MSAEPKDVPSPYRRAVTLAGAAQTIHSSMSLPGQDCTEFPDQDLNIPQVNYPDEANAEYINTDSCVLREHLETMLGHPLPLQQGQAHQGVHDQVPPFRGAKIVLPSSLQG